MLVIIVNGSYAVDIGFATAASRYQGVGGCDTDGVC